MEIYKMVEQCNTIPSFLYNTFSCLPEEDVTYLTFIISSSNISDCPYSDSLYALICLYFGLLQSNSVIVFLISTTLNGILHIAEDIIFSQTAYL